MTDVPQWAVERADEVLDFGKGRVAIDIRELKERVARALAEAAGPKWQPIETLMDERKNSGKPLLRPHIHWGVMSVKKPNPHGELEMPEGCDWYMVGYSCAWPERAFLPFWMEPHAAPGVE